MAPLTYELMRFMAAKTHLPLKLGTQISQSDSPPERGVAVAAGLQPLFRSYVTQQTSASSESSQFPASLS